MNPNTTNPLITNPMLSGVIERQMYVWATLISVKIVAGLGLDPMSTDWVSAGILSFVAGALGWWQNRPAVIAAQAANIAPEHLTRPEVAAALATAASAIPNPAAPDGKTVVVTSPSIAAATPEAPTVVSSAVNQVVQK